MKGQGEAGGVSWARSWLKTMGNYTDQNSFCKTGQARLENSVDLFLEMTSAWKGWVKTCLNDLDRGDENRYSLSWVNVFKWAVGQMDRDICCPDSSQIFPSFCTDYTKLHLFSQILIFWEYLTEWSSHGRNRYFKNCLVPRCSLELWPEERIWGFCMPTHRNLCLHC